MSRSAMPTRVRLALLTGALVVGTALAPVGTSTELVAPRPANAAVSGMFKVICDFSHRAGDDPIVYPGQPGKAHLHDFFGNRTTDAFSTLASLSRGGTTCGNAHDKAAYWAPVLYQDGRAVTPTQVQAYYRGSNRDPGAIRTFPTGLKMVAGSSMATKPQSVDVAGWTCIDNPPNFSATMPTCKAGQKLRNRIRFPECWDGTHLDSPDHHSHLAYLVNGRCPAGHPVAVPRLDIEVHYGAIPGGASRVRLSSGSWTSLHADFFNAWDATTLQGLVRRCLNTPTKCDIV